MIQEWDMINMNRMSRFLRFALLTCAVTSLVTYVVIVFFRIKYPFALEWIEGSAVNHVRRILSGQKLYVSPSLKFVPGLYTPLYFYLSAVVSYFFGVVGFIPLRFVSFVSSLGCFYIIFLMVKRETGSTFPAVLASGLFAATFRISGGWFDIARVDSLFLFLLLAGLFLIRFKGSAKSHVLAGIFFSLSFLTKQTALIVSLPIMLYCLYSNWRRAPFFIATVAGIVVLGTFFLNWIHDGWYLYYTFRMPAHHPVAQSMYKDFWIFDMLEHLFVACSLSVYYLCNRMKNSPKGGALFYVSMSVGMVGAAWISRLHSGGYPNVLFPAYAAISILFGLAAHNVLEFAQSKSLGKKRSLEVSVYLVCIVQFIFLGYNPLRQIPTREDLMAGRELVQMMELVEGDIFIPGHNYLNAMAGKKIHAHAMAMNDMLRGEKDQNRMNLVSEFKEAFRGKKFDLVILDTAFYLRNWLDESDIDGYRLAGYCRNNRPVFDREQVFRPVSGLPTRPNYIYYACSEEP